MADENPDPDADPEPSKKLLRLPWYYDRPRGVLTPRDRRYLIGDSDIEPYSAHERNVRRTIRERVWNGLLDMVLIAGDMDDRDLAKILSPEDEDEGEEEGYTSDAARNDALEALTELAYRYAGEPGADRRSSFEGYIEEAVNAVDTDVDPDGEGVVVLGRADVDLNVTYPRYISIDEIFDKFDRLPADPRTWTPAEWKSFNFHEIQFLVWILSKHDHDDSVLWDLTLLVYRWHLESGWQFTVADGLEDRLSKYVDAETTSTDEA